MATSKALGSQDILAVVFHHIFNIEQERLRQATLASAAVVCRTFSDPALDALWRESHIFPVFSILPSFTKRGSGGFRSTRYAFTRAPSLDEWQRFWWYARRVRVLHARDASWFREGVWEAVSTAQDSTPGLGPLFPSLVRMDLVVQPGHTLQFLDILHYAPNIRYMDVLIEDGVSAEVAQMASQQMHHTFLQLHTLIFSRYSGTTALIPYWEYTQLRSLSIFAPGVVVTPRNMIALASFPQLEILSLSFESLEPGFRTGAEKPVFNALTFLRFSGTIDDQSTLFSWASFPHVIDVHLDLQGVWDHTLLIDIINRLSSNPIRSFGILMTPAVSNDASEPQGEIHFGDIISPLLRCAGMELFRFRYVDPQRLLLLHDHTLRSIVNVWPRLTSFEIHKMSVIHNAAAARRPPPSAPTIHTLAAFADAHPKLKMLHLPYTCIPAEMIHSEDYSEETGITVARMSLDNLPVLHHGLQELYIDVCGMPRVDEITAGGGQQRASGGHPRISDKDYEKMVLRLFPSIRCFELAGGPYTTYE